MPTLLRTNLCLNPSVEVDTFDFTQIFTTLSSSSFWATIGNKSLSMASNGTTGDCYAALGGDAGAIRLGLVAGKTYTVSATINTPTALTGTLDNRARAISFFYKDGSYQAINSPAGPVTGTARVSSTVSIPIGSTEAFIRLYNGSPTLNEMVYWDGILVEEAATIKTYFDGNTTDTAFKLYDWTGSVNASTSTESSVLSKPASQYSVGDLEFEYYSRLSGLASGSLNDHKYKYLKDLLVLPNRSLADLELIHFKNQSGLINDSISDYKSKVFVDNGGSERAYYMKNFI